MPRFMLSSVVLCSVLFGVIGLADSQDEHGQIKQAFVGHFELVPQVKAALCAKDSAVRARGAFLLGQIGDRSATNDLIPLLKDPSRAVRYQTGIALCALGDSRGLPAAVAALQSAADWVRYYAVHALAALETDRARAALELQREYQGEFIREQIDEVLETWPWPSVQPLAAQEKLGPFDSLRELFEAAADELVVESDGYWHQGQYFQCVRCNEAALLLDPHYVDLYGTSAWLLWSSDRNDRAISLLRDGLRANPDNWEMWFDVGFHYVLLKQYTTAARLLKRAVELGAPADFSRQYCHALEHAGRPDLALEAWENLLKRFPDDLIAPGQIERLRKQLSAVSEM
ncbi:MAG: HEAT repeat domain-containing protein [Candidatus Zipacnadales bacterium]